MKPAYSTKASAPPWPVFIRRALALALMWWALTGGQWGAWWFVLPVLLAATLAPLGLPEPTSVWRLSLMGCLHFVPFFLRHSIRGGLDVARRALAPRLDVQPGLYRHELEVPTETARIFLSHVVSLLPGTLSADLSGTTLTVHALSGREAEVVRDLREVERVVNRLFGLKGAGG
jgi:multicomponent Na+:H+ antiporter subunit E